MAKHKRRLHLDIDDVDMLTDLSIEDDVTVSVKGKIKAISAPRKYEDGEEPELYPGDITVEVDSLKIESGRNVFSEMDENDGSE